MKKSTLYETGFFFPPIILIAPFFLAFIEIFIYNYFHISETSYLLILLFAALYLFDLIGICMFLIVFLTQFKNVIVPFHSHKFNLIKGVVCNLVNAKTKRGVDFFEIGGIHFIIGKKWIAGLQKTRIQGGPSIEEGQFLCISYIPVKSNNIIVRVEYCEPYGIRTEENPKSK